jgi:hypothetical protein
LASYESLLVSLIGSNEVGSATVLAKKSLVPGNFTGTISSAGTRATGERLPQGPRSE